MPAHRYQALDGLRAVAATCVVITHVAFWTGHYTGDWAGRIFARFDIGVALFFVLSGFVLSVPMFRAAAAGEPLPGIGGYFWRRALRILPAYWLTVVLTLLLLPGNASAGLGTWLRHLALLQIYGAGWTADGLVHTWSLCTEVSFYLVLPFAARGMLRLVGGWRPGRLLLVIAVASLLGMVWLGAVTADTAIVAPLNLWLPAFAAWFGAGTALAVLVTASPEWRPVRVVHELATHTGTCLAAAGALFWVACTDVAGPLGLDRTAPAEAVLKSALYVAVAVLVVAPLIFDERPTPLRRFLTCRPMAYLGEVSYGLFLVHMMVLLGLYAVLDMSAFTGSMPVVMVVVWTLSVALAGASHRFIEAPLARRWRTPSLIKP